MTFTPSDYAAIGDGSRRSAEFVVPLIMDLLKPATVVDVGCGEGSWGRVFADHGAQVWGVDGHDGATIEFPYRQVDLARAKLLNFGPADLAVCLEVAEHLPAASAPGLIQALCVSAPAVLFSAAIPSQGGIGHLNEQPPAYWADLFRKNNFFVTGALRWTLWDDAPRFIEYWYAQNLLLAMAEPGNLAALFEGPASEPHYVIHPVLWTSR